MDDSLTQEVRSYPDLPAMSSGAAEEIGRLARLAVDKRGRFALALAGGGTPRPVYQLLASAYRDRLPWAQVHLFWGDERYVSPEAPQSNYRMIREALLDRAPLSAENIHPMPTHLPDPEAAAHTYEATLRSYFSDSGPEFDLVLLGLGTDGHTASLFPGSPALEERERWVVAVRAPVEPSLRLSLSLPAINSARQVLFLVSGAEKREVVHTLFRNPAHARPLFPAAMVRPRGRVVWFLDKAARGEA